MSSLEDLRSKIDEIDKQIIRLLNERARIVVDVGKLKNSLNDAIYAPGREREVFQKVLAFNKGPLSNRCIKAVYRELMSGSFELEKPLKIAYLGPPGTFTHMSARVKFGESVAYHPVDTLEDVFREVCKKSADYGIVPIENSTGGTITETLDLFMEYDCKVCAEVVIPIHHNLLSKYKLNEIEKVFSKQQVFTQCRLWLNENLHNVELVDCPSTTKATQMALEEPASAAIASVEASRTYGLAIIAESIEDRVQNFTRFFVIGDHFSRRTGEDKTTVMFSIKDETGALFEMLRPFKENDINLTKIESRPSPTTVWDYVFFIDLEGHFHDDKVEKALKQLERKCKMLKILGSFPREITTD